MFSQLVLTVCPAVSRNFYLHIKEFCTYAFEVSQTGLGSEESILRQAHGNTTEPSSSLEFCFYPIQSYETTRVITMHVCSNYYRSVTINMACSSRTDHRC